TDSGTGSQERKLQGVARLLQSVNAKTAKFLVRIPISKMRLGFSDKTVLDALSVMTSGDKSAKAELEAAYNVRPDVGRLAVVVRKEGIEAVSKLQEPELGVPILMAKAQRASSAEEILLKIGDCIVEPKIDGFRLQVHKRGEAVKLYTRGLEDVTFMYPDIVTAVNNQIKAKDVIIEGEAIAYDLKTGKNLPFQETVQRKRKHGINELAKSVPLKLIAFELLYLDGESFLNKPFDRRRKELEDIITNGDRIVLSEKTSIKLGEEEKLEQVFQKALADNFEGIMAKRLDAKYVAGARNFNWIKYKKSYSSSLSDTIDAVVLGYDLGKGKRTQFGIGGFLVGVYDEDSKLYRTVSKVGTGLSDDQWRELREKSEKLRVSVKPKEYEVYDMVDVDVWLDPKIVVELEADELTISTMHSAGLALRFPRLKRFRDDKQALQATTLTEAQQLFKNQIK
ncbi:MAG: ATP-dependent DNA ligase, partial [bacterium]|nr:ATP-dependent DNA ligase [bacterium]